MSVGLRSPISGRFSGLRGHVSASKREFFLALSILHPPRLTFSLERLRQVALPTTTAACGAGKGVAACRLWLSGKTQRVQAHSATQPACVPRFSAVSQPDKRETHPTAVQPDTTLCAGAAADMTQQGATLQNYNNELVKCAHQPPSCSAARIHAQLRPASHLQALRTSGRSVRR